MTDNFRMPSAPIALVVDDEPLILMDTSDIISDAGYDVIEARTADEAIEVLKQNGALTLLFTDIQMPGEMDGIGLAWYVAEHWPHICVIVASGAVAPKNGVLPESAHFMGKPISPQLVLEALDEVCA